MRKGSIVPTNPRRNPMRTADPRTRAGLVKGCWRAPAIKAGKLTARKNPMRIAITAVVISIGRHGSFACQVSEYFRRRSSKVFPAPVAWARACSYRSWSSAGISNRTSPSDASTSRRIAFPVVVLPQPLSPTRHTISPRRTSRSIPSTAFTQPSSSERISPRRLGRRLNQTFRPRTRIRGSSPRAGVAAPP